MLWCNSVDDEQPQPTVHFVDKVVVPHANEEGWFSFQDPDGEWRWVPPSKVEEALKEGYKPESTEEYRKRIGTMWGKPGRLTMLTTGLHYQGEKFSFTLYGYGAGWKALPLEGWGSRNRRPLLLAEEKVGLLGIRERGAAFWQTPKAVGQVYPDIMDRIDYEFGRYAVTYAYVAYTSEWGGGTGIALALRKGGLTTILSIACEESVYCAPDAYGIFKDFKIGGIAVGKTNMKAIVSKFILWERFEAKRLKRKHR